VRLVLTGAETAELGNMPCTVIPAGVTVPPTPYQVLARDEVRHVGDEIAFVTADTPEKAKAAAEAIEVVWEVLPHVVGGEAALAPGAPQVWPDRPGNIAWEAALGDASKTADGFAKAKHTVSLRIVNQRLVTNYLDTRGAVADYEADKDRVTLTIGSQGSHIVRNIISELVLKWPKDKLRVVTPDVGGGFGTKLFPYSEYALTAFAARQLKRPVKWVADRTEHFLGDTHGRDNITVAKLALDEDGRFLALEVDTIADMGAYLSTFAPYIPYIGAGMLPGVYAIPACHVRIRAAYTNTVPVDAYRGAGRPEASYVIERLVDVAARELGIAPDALRRKNFIKPKAMPYTTPTGKVYDSGDFAGHMARAQELADWKGFNKRVTAAKRAGRMRGIGVATYIEACGGNGPDTATITLNDDGTVTVLSGNQSTGQGHQTAYAQLVADHLGLPPDRVTVRQGDTAMIATGTGTGGSSGMTCGGMSVSGAARKLAENLKQLGADALETSAGDLEFAGGLLRVAGTDRAVSFADLARRGHDKRDMLTTSDAYAPRASTFPNGTHVAEVEIDPATGQTHLVKYVIVDDFGVTLNPLLLAGQIHGGTVQGIGQALMENTVYDRDSGQLMSASLMDYALPRAADTPPFVFETRNVPCKTHPLGIKGAGEAGAVGSCPAIINAISDALWRAFRIKHIDMPATPERIWAALEEGRRVHSL
jgi:carbon-monoxide dehydrogenase large subunit